MADALLESILGRGKNGSTGDPLLDSVLSAKDAGSSDPLLDSILSGKPQEQQQKVQPPSSHIWETAKGAGRGLIDFISRPNYAAAGAAEELLSPQGRGIGGVLPRIGSEIFSGLGDIEGKKKGFGQVMEQAGVGELGRLSDVLPFLFNETGEGAALQRGGVMDPSGRGAIGLAADIALDPTTYLTAGGGVTRKFATAKGVKYLSKEGTLVRNSIYGEFKPAISEALKITDEAARFDALKKIDDAFRSKVLDAVESKPGLLEKTGIKFMGQEIVSPESLNVLTDTAKRVVMAVPGGGVVADAAKGMSDSLRNTFDKYADVAKLPEQEREAFKFVIRQNVSAKAAHDTALKFKWNEIWKDYSREARKYGRGEAGLQALGKKITDLRQGTGSPVLTDAESTIAKRIFSMYDEMEPVLLREGILDADQVAKHAGKYLHQSWRNTDEALAETAKRAGIPIDRIIKDEQIQKARIFATVQEGVDVSKRLNATTLADRAAGLNREVYGELVPEYNVMSNLASYIEQSTKAIWRKKAYDEVAQKFGHVLDETYQTGRYQLDNFKSLGYDKNSAVNAAVYAARDSGYQNLSAAKALAAKFGERDQKELVRRLISEAKSPSQVVNIEREFGDKLLPEIRFVKEGTVDPYYARFPGQGVLRTVGGDGGLWGDKAIQLPAGIIKMVEEAPRDFIMDAANKRNLQGFVKAWDKYNNLFKAMTYPFYPSGAVRDTYNNVMQAFLGIGVGGFARPFQAVRALKGGADDVLRLGGQDWTAKEINTMMKDLGVIDPSGAAYVQFTGDGPKPTGLLAKARAKRGSVDNLTRSQLFINSLAQGMTPQDAAQVVKDFLFDYGELSNFDKDFMRRVMPFYVFPRKAIESYGRAVVKTPGRVVNLAKPFRGREDENNAMTTWEGEGFKLRLDRNGKDLTMLNGVDLPVRTMDMLWAGSPSKTMNRWLSMASPSIKVPYEFLSGQDPFRGQPLGRQQTYALGPLLEQMPKPLQRWAGYQKETDKAGRPKYTIRMDRVQVLAEAALISRIFSMSERNAREQMRDPDNAARMLDFLTGLRLKSLNLDEEQKRKQEMWQKIAEEEAVKQGDKREFRKVYTPKGR